MSIEAQIARGHRIAAAEKAKLAKRGDVVAVREPHSATMMHGPTTHWETWRLVKAAHVNRVGLVMSVVVNGIEHRTTHAGGRLEPLTIAGTGQTLARGMYGEAPEREWATQDDLREALLARAGAP